ncbi:MAG: DNA-processing protein DprA [Patescibacteria group bacterium]|nr:DNA-processing protein DprA [Patescibacteria group bacterium]MDE2438415.1 DNA-processing protein DprA [Patescibacteria group bacterium]
MPEEEKQLFNALAIATDNDYFLMRALHMRYGTYTQAYQSLITKTIDQTDLDEKTNAKLHETEKALRTLNPGKEYATLINHNITLLLREESDLYPPHLTTLPQPPLGLYLQGDITAFTRNTATLGIVGTRTHSSYGKVACERIVPTLARYPITIISGLALGIDTLAHALTLAHGGTTIAVIGNGFSSWYPHQNKELAHTIIKKGGAVISEYHFATPPHKFNFPRRNRIVAGLTQAILVIEAPEKSGSLITARYALELNKDVLAIPGAINSRNAQGTNALIKDGALVITSPEDILQYFNLTALHDLHAYELTHQEEEILALLDKNNGTMQTDSLLAQCAPEEAAQTTALLTEMELKDYIEIWGTHIIKK